MEQIWGKNGVSVRQVHRVLLETEVVAYTTIMDRLWQKGILTRRRDGVDADLTCYYVVVRT